MTFCDSRVKRKLDLPYKGNTFEQDFKYIGTVEGIGDVLTKAFERIYSPNSQLSKIITEDILTNWKEIFETKEIAWHLERIIGVLMKERGKGYSLTIKGCSDCQFFALRNRDGKLVEKPFFHRNSPPFSSNQEQNIRGLGDTLFFLAPAIKQILQDCKEDDHLIKKLTDLLSWFEIKLDIGHWTPIGDGDAFEIKGKASITSYHRLPIDESKMCIKLDPKAALVLVASPNFRTAVESLARA